MHTLLITGANRGIGLEAAAQLASLGKFDRIILTARTAEKGEAAVKAALAQATLQPGRNFSFAVQSLASAASRYVRALTDESFPRRFASGAVVGGPYIFYANGEDGELYDQSAFSSYYGDEELQAEATRVVRTAAML